MQRMQPERLQGKSRCSFSVSKRSHKCLDVTSCLAIKHYSCSCRAPQAKATNSHSLGRQHTLHAVLRKPHSSCCTGTGHRLHRGWLLLQRPREQPLLAWRWLLASRCVPAGKHNSGCSKAATPWDRLQSRLTWGDTACQQAAASLQALSLWPQAIPAAGERAQEGTPAWQCPLQPPRQPACPSCWPWPWAG